FLLSAEHRIHAQVFRPVDACIGTVFLIHGYLEHSAIYQPIIAELLQEQFAVVTFDLPGHGLSSGASASIQEFAIYQQVLNDLWAWSAAQAATDLPKPWLGIGQSTGGAIWLDHILRRSGRRQSLMVDRLLLLSPLVRPTKTAWWHNPLGLSLLSLVKRDVPRAFRRNNHNPDFLRFIRKFDPLQPRMMGMPWILALSRWMVWIEDQPRCRVPVWVAQGARDQTVDWRYTSNLFDVNAACKRY
ncbi:MAG: alpha/beta hydrolase, partial [Flavobacteriales bacterium]